MAEQEKRAGHIPVLLKEAIEILNPKPGEDFIDCTLGAGGHTAELLKRTSPNGIVLGIDLDNKAIQAAKLKCQSSNVKTDRLITVEGNFRDLEKIVQQNNFKNISGILLDLGFSSMEIDDPQRGLSFKYDGPLDMRFGREGMTASEVVNNFKEKELENIFRTYGEERFSGRIARSICEIRKDRPIETTFELISVIKRVIPQKFQHGRIHFATKVFQALRIYVNEELDNLVKVLPQAIDLLPPGGRIAVISFHSLEDRIVKDFFRQESRNCVCPKEIPLCQCNHKAKLKILNKKPIIPKEGEAKTNPRSRSAKLRAAVKL
jgi:16S rRNA (cytosine1402-N4)-methyltransferase